MTQREQPSKHATQVGGFRIGRWWPDALAVLWLIGFWLWKCSDVFRRFFDALYGVAAGIDGTGMVWMSWWAHQAFSSPDYALFYTPLLNYPVGAEVFTYDVAYLHILLAGLLHSWLGLIGSINFVFVVGVLSGLIGTYVLVRQVTPSRVLAAGMAMLPVMFGLFTDWDAADLAVVNYGFFALALAAWLAMTGSHGRKWVIPTGALIALTLVAQMYYGIALFVVLGVAMVLAALRVTPSDGPRFVVWRRTAAATAIGLALALPHVVISLGGIRPMGRAIVAAPLSEVCAPDWRFGFWLAWLLVGLGVLAAIGLSRRMWFWFVACGAVLLLGIDKPCFHLGGGDAWLIPGPAALLKNYVPYLWRMTFPARLLRIAMVLVPVFLAAWSTAVIGRWSLRRRPAAAVMGIALLLGALAVPILSGRLDPTQPWGRMVRTDGVVRALRPFPTTPGPDVPAVFEEIRDEAGDFAIFDLDCRRSSELSMFLQTVHERPIPGDFIRPHELPEPSELTILQRDLCRDENTPLPEIDWWRQRQVKYALLHNDPGGEAGGDFLTRWETRFGSPVFRDATLSLYKITASE